jgi:hypothetical protein
MGTTTAQSLPDGWAFQLEPPPRWTATPWEKPIRQRRAQPLSGFPYISHDIIFLFLITPARRWIRIQVSQLDTIFLSLFL